MPQSVHRTHFDPTQVQISQLLSIKTGGCPEDCGYCSQSVHNKTGLKATKLMEVEAVLADARAAKASRRVALLHGRRLAEPQGQGSGHGLRHGRRRARRWAWRPALPWGC